MLRSLLSRFTDLTHGKRIVFLAINKTGSSSLWTWMDEQGVPYLMNRYREDEARKLRIIAEVKRKGLPCFTVVRNPWARAVSSWKWCVQEKGLAPCGFEEFLRIPLASMTEQQRFHTLPQWRHVVDGQGGIDYLAHVGGSRRSMPLVTGLPTRSGCRVPVRCRISRAAAPTTRSTTRRPRVHWWRKRSAAISICSAIRRNSSADVAMRPR